MTVSAFAGRGWKLVVETEQIEITSNSPRPDPNWRFTDAAGHEHFYDKTAKGYPTLDAVSEEPYWCADCREEHEEDRLECLRCMEVVTPGVTGPSMFREFIPGPTSVHVELDDGRVIPVTNEEWAALRVAGESVDSFVQAIAARAGNRG